MYMSVCCIGVLYVLRNVGQYLADGHDVRIDGWMDGWMDGCDIGITFGLSIKKGEGLTRAASLP